MKILIPLSEENNYQIHQKNVESIIKIMNQRNKTYCKCKNLN